jgi:CDP-4-dehydro-6-deoxyglucose reductase
MQIKTIEDKTIDGSSQKSILDCALDQGFVFDYSCKRGLCGACKARLIEGSVRELTNQSALSQSDRDSNQILLCACVPESDVLIDAEDLSALHGIVPKTLAVRISSIAKRSKNLVEVNLRFPPNAEFRYLEGQYVDVIAAGGIRRSYSLASSSSSSEITLVVKRVEGGQLSDYWFNRAQDNDLLRIEGPKGTFFFRNDATQNIFLATGSGIAPFIGMLKRLSENDAEVVDHGSIDIFWGNRDAEDFFWKPDDSGDQLKYNPVLSKQAPDWSGLVGYVQDFAIQKVNSFDDLNVYACGSEQMINSARELFLRNGLDERRFFSDVFVRNY